MKNFFRGMLTVLAIEFIIFTFVTFNIKTETTVSYEPTAILNVLGEGWSSTH